MKGKNQGLISGSPEEEKDMLDLNKVPSKSDSSSSASGSEYFAGIGDACNTASGSLLVCDNNAYSRDDGVASDFKDDTGDNEKICALNLPNSDILHEGDNEKKCALNLPNSDILHEGDNEKKYALNLPNSDISHEGMGRSQSSKIDEEDVVHVGGDQSVSPDGQVKVNDVPKGRRGRKKKGVCSSQSPRATELNYKEGHKASKGRRGRKRKVAVTISCDRDLETVSENLIHAEARVERRGRKRKVLKIDSEKEVALRAASEEKSCCLESQASEKNREESSETNVAKRSADVDIVEAGDVGQNTKKDMQMYSSKRRGRKRKMKAPLEENDDDEIIDKKVVISVPADKCGNVGRVLRSRTLVESDPEKQAHAKGNGGLPEIELVEEHQTSDERDIESKMDVSAQSQQSQSGMKEMKKRRGRPPKLHKKKGNPNVSEKKRGRGRPPKFHKENGNSKDSVKKKVKLGTQTSIKKPKTTFASNSLKVQTRNTSSAQVDNEKEKTEDCKESNNQLAPGSEKCSGDRCQGYPEGGSYHSELSTKDLDKSDCKNKENSALRRSEAKQLVRDEIVSILKNAGWTIEYRPRVSKEYLDSVYVDWEGRGYWSATLAYKKLRARVQDGTADSKAVAAFIPIPDEKLRMLFRIATGKRGEGKKKEKVNKDVNEIEKVTKAGKKKEKINKAGKKIVNEVKKQPSKRGRPKLNRRTETKKRCTLLARRSENGMDPSSDGYVRYEGKQTLLSWMIDSGTLPLGAKIHITKGTEETVIFEGKISREGICCGCCDAGVTFSVFQSHAGCKHDQPFDNIYLDSGRSLSQCLTDAWRKHVDTNHIGFYSVDVNGDDPNDDTCNLCGDGGDLICCDSCPSTFHLGCLRIQNFPSGDWQCVYCSCKFCEIVGRPCITDDVEDTDDFSLLTCLLCEERFHIACIQGKDDIHNCKESILFCGRECQKIFEQLQKVLGVRHELEDGFSWTILRYQDVECNENCSPDSSKVVCNSKLVLAFNIMDECFSPIIDQRSQTNMIEHVVFSSGSNFRRLNYSGFCTVILERDEELVAAASIRIHGNQLAEMPFIGTRYMYRRQGMCRRLLSAIEMALSSIDVEKLVIPAVPALNDTWTNVFGFGPLEDSSRQDMKYMSMAVFPGTDMLQKLICKSGTTDVNVTCASATLKDEKSQDVGTPQSSVTPPSYSSEAPQYDSGTVFCDDKEVSECKLESKGVECVSDDKDLLRCKLELNGEIQKCELDLNRDCGVECSPVDVTAMGPCEKVLVDETLHEAEEEKELSRHDA